MTKDQHVHLVVVGFGGAGAAAAITAHDLGADVRIIEKAAAGGGSTAASGGNIRLVEDAEGAIEHLGHLVGAGVDHEIVRCFVEGLIELPSWLAGMGAEFEPHDQFSDQALGVARPGSSYPHLPGAAGLGSRVQIRRPQGTSGGEALWQLMEAAVTSRRIATGFGARAVRLLRTDGRVSGVEVTDSDGTHRVHARDGVILSCGGFEWDRELLADTFGAVLPSMSPVHLNAGDGIRLAQEVGAQMWHMTAVTARYGFVVGGHEAAFTSTPPAQGLFLVDQDGRRYVDEAGVDGHSAGLLMLARDPSSGALRRLPSYLVFDETTRLAGPLGTQTSGHNRRYAWSKDNIVEIENGWIVSSDTVEGLADKIGVPRENLALTTASFNVACVTGEDPWRRLPERMVPLSTPPYYAIALWPILLNTQGGPRRNAATEILDVRGDPIPGLYGAGELGSMWGPLYPGAVNIAEALITGRIAARTAVSPSPARRTRRPPEPDSDGSTSLLSL